MSQTSERFPRRHKSNGLIDRSQMDEMSQGSSLQPLIAAGAVALVAVSLLAYVMDSTERSRPLNHDPSGRVVQVEPAPTVARQPAKGGGWTFR